MLARPDPPLPPLTRIVEVPVFAPDGTLQTTYYRANLVVITFPPVGNEADRIPSVDAGSRGRCPYRAMPPMAPIFLCISAMAVSSVAIP
jgi:hypothetical protein